MHQRKRFCSGFTLVELMITIAVISVIAFIGVPSLKTMLENNRISAQTNRLVSSIHLARSEAVKRNAEVTLCPVGEGSSCGSEWRKGWMVVAGNEVLQVVEVDDQVVDVPSAPAKLVFNGEGRVVGGESRIAGSHTIVIRKASYAKEGGGITHSVEVTGGGHVSTGRSVGGEDDGR